MTTLRLKGSDPGDIALAAQLLREGRVAAIPTETVYGLAADALNSQAVAGIFEAKGRPADNPLIVHISGVAQLNELCLDIPAMARALAEAYWPGPLTMVLKKRDMVPDIVTGGLDTVGVRMPAHPVARGVIEAAGTPLAAPSANLSGTPSPTTAAHVLADFDGKIAAVVDGGPCPLGLESTVVDVTGPQPVVLRPGAVTAQMIADVCGSVAQGPQRAEAGETPRSPGVKYRHYAPKTPMTLFRGPMAFTAEAILQRADHGKGVLSFAEYLPRMKAAFGAALSLGEGGRPEAHARRLYGALRELDGTGVTEVLAQCPRPYGLGAATANRLERAAAHNIVDCTGGKRIVGVTGRSGSGKGVFAAHLAGPGVLVLDADRIYNRLLRENEEMKGLLFAHFPGIEAEGQVDKTRLGQIVFNDPEKREDLNLITHGYVMREMERSIRTCIEAVVILDVPLLFESRIDHFCDITVGILADPIHSAKRIMARDGITEERAMLRLNAQPDDDYYRQRCDVILENYGSLAELQKKITAFHQKYVIDSAK